MIKFFLTAMCFLLLFCMPAISEENSLHYWENLKNIRVYVPSKSEYTALMKKAFDEWENASKGKIRFIYVSAPHLAQNVVVFTDKFSDNKLGTSATKKAVVCYPIYKSVNGKPQKVCDERNTTSYAVNKTITISSMYPKSNSKMTNDEIYSVMLHEIGHSIGLKHSENKNDLMYPRLYEHEVKSITENDVKALYDIYGWKYK